MVKRYDSGKNKIMQLGVSVRSYCFKLSLFCGNQLYYMLL